MVEEWWWSESWGMSSSTGVIPESPKTGDNIFFLLLGNSKNQLSSDSGFNSRLVSFLPTLLVEEWWWSVMRVPTASNMIIDTRSS
jgi:hypothetical protein